LLACGWFILFVDFRIKLVCLLHFSRLGRILFEHIAGQMAAGLLVDLPELKIPNDVIGYLVAFLGLPDLYRYAETVFYCVLQTKTHLSFAFYFCNWHLFPYEQLQLKILFTNFQMN
jgi:hypothetical protein